MNLEDELLFRDNWLSGILDEFAAFCKDMPAEQEYYTRKRNQVAQNILAELIGRPVEIPGPEDKLNSPSVRG